MYLSKVLPFFLFPVLLLADPAPQAIPTIPASAINDLTQLIDGAKTLLSQSSINNIETTLTGAATLLSGSTANDTKSLLTSVNGLLSPDLIKAVENLVTVDTVNKLGDIVNNAHTLLSAQFVNETVTLVNDVTPVSFFDYFLFLVFKADHVYVVGGESVKGARRVIVCASWAMKKETNLDSCGSLSTTNPFLLCPLIFR